MSKGFWRRFQVFTPQFTELKLFLKNPVTKSQTRKNLNVFWKFEKNVRNMFFVKSKIHENWRSLKNCKKIHLYNLTHFEKRWCNCMLFAFNSGPSTLVIEVVFNVFCKVCCPPHSVLARLRVESGVEYLWEFLTDSIIKPQSGEKWGGVYFEV